jgi:hypothetical protein
MDTGFSSHRPDVRGLADVAHPRPGSVSVSKVTELIFVRAQRSTNFVIKAIYAL